MCTNKNINIPCIKQPKTASKNLNNNREIIQFLTLYLYNKYNMNKNHIL